MTLRVIANRLADMPERPAIRPPRDEGKIPEGWVPEAWLDPSMPGKALYSAIVLIIACVGLPLGVQIGKVITAAIFFAIWG